MSVIRKWVAVGAVAFGALAGGLSVWTVPALAAAGKPVVVSEAVAAGFGPLDATLEAKINPGEQETEYHFEYAEKETGGVLEGAKEVPVPGLMFTENLSEEQTAGPIDIGGGLMPSTTYYYRVVASNASGETKGLVKHFTTTEAPITRQATSISGTTATLNGELNPNASGASGYYFSYNQGSSCEGGKTTPSGEKAGEGVKVSASIGLVEPLEGNTKYTFCLVATSTPTATETLVGGPKTFFTLAIAPKIDGESAPSPTPFSVELEAQINPENQPTTSCVFEYGKVAVSEHSVTCTPLSVEGLSDQPVKGLVTGLEPATKYHYRVVVGNPTGMAPPGVEQEFMTPPTEKPVVENPTVSGVTPFEAKLEAQVSPDYQKASCVFEYGKSVHEYKAACEPGSLEGGRQTVSLLVKGLEPSTSYHFHIAVKNPIGETVGESEFKTNSTEKPVVEALSVTGVTPYEEKLEAQVNSEYQKTTCVFEYGEKEAIEKKPKKGVEEPFEHNVECEPSSFEGSPLVSRTVTSLTPGTLYLFRVVAKNAAGETVGGSEFRTKRLRVPEVESESAGGVTPSGATLAGSVNPRFQNTSCVFEYGTEPLLKANTKTVACTPQLGTGGSGVPVSAVLSGLEAGKSYYYRVVAVNGTGSAIWAETGEEVPIGSFETPALTPPIVENEKTSEVSAIHAELEATVNPVYQKTTVTFEYSSSESAVLEGKGDQTISGSTIAAGIDTPQAESADLGSALTPGVTYYYRVVAENETSSNEHKPTKGTLSEITLPVAPVLTIAAAQSITENSATLSGTVDPEGVETKYHYVYTNQAGYDEALALGDFREGEVDPTFNPYAGGGSTPEVTITAEHAIRSEIAAQPFTLTPLTPGAKYEYALVATSTQEVNGQPVATTVIGPGETFTVEGEIEGKPVPVPIPEEYPTGPLAAPAPVTPVPLLTVTGIQFPKEEGGTVKRSLTNAEKLKSALKACKKKHPKSKQTACEKQARKRYATKPKKKKKK